MTAPARLFRLGWSEFWLLGSILAGILALVGLVFWGYSSDVLFSGL